jgi:hypothetical protein
MRRTLLILGVLTLLTMTTPAQAQAQGHPGTAVATGSVSVVAERTAKALLHVPQQATLDLTAVADTLEGGDSFTGVLLREAGAPDGLDIRVVRYPQILEYSRYTMTRGRVAQADRPTGDLNIWGVQSSSCTRCTLPAGDYELLVVAEEGATTSATLTFEGLADVSAIDDADLQPVASRVMDTDSHAESQTDLMNGGVSRGHCCFTGGTTVWQFATALDTHSLSRATHEFCMRPNGSSECHGGSKHEFVGTAGPDNLASFGHTDLGDDVYATSSRLNYLTVTALDFEFDADILWVGW